jgi:hypothetical protein
MSIWYKFVAIKIYICFLLYFCRPNNVDEQADEIYSADYASKIKEWLLTLTELWLVGLTSLLRIWCIWSASIEEQFEDIKPLTGSCKWEKDRQYKSQKKKGYKAKQWSSTQKTKDGATWVVLNTGEELAQKGSYLVHHCTYDMFGPTNELWDMLYILGAKDRQELLLYYKIRTDGL